MKPQPWSTAALAEDTVRRFIKMTLALAGLVAFAVLDFGLGFGDHFHGTPKQVAFALVMCCAVPAVALYFPLQWWAIRALRRSQR